VEFRILGPLEVEANGRLLELGTLKERTLLALLLLNAGRFVSADRIVEEIWGESPPPSASKLVQTYVSHLRKVVPGVIETHGRGYVARVPADDLDLTRFRSLVSDGSSRALRAALELWRGDPLEDIPLAGAARVEVAGLVDLRVDAIARRIALDLDDGRHSEVIPELRALLEREPYREDLRAQLMLALYQAGRPAAALDAYHDARRALADDLGLEPGPELQQLQSRILNHDETLAGTRRAVPVVRRRRPLLALVASLVIATLAAAIGIFLASRGSQAHAAPVVAAANSVLVLDAHTGRAVADVSLDAVPTRVAASGGSVWVTSAGSRIVYRLSTSARRVESTIGVGFVPGELAAGPRSAWILDRSAKRMVAIEPPYTDVIPRTPVSAAELPSHQPTFADAAFDAAGVTVGAGSVWVERASGLVESAARATQVTTDSNDIAYGDGSLWITRGRPAQLLRVDPHRLTVVATVPFGTGTLAPYPFAVAALGMDVWVSSANTGTLTHVDPSLGTIAATVRIGINLTRPAPAPSAAWIADSDAGVIYRVDARTNAVTRKITLRGPGTPVDLAYDGGDVWVALA
jgi:DNA-binding SARP family transcriptional activator